MNYVTGSLIIAVGIAVLLDIRGLPTRAVLFSQRMASLRFGEPENRELAVISRFALGVMVTLIGILTMVQ